MTGPRTRIGATLRAFTPGRSAFTSGRMRHASAGLIDQAVIAAANAATTLLGAILLDVGRAGLMILAVVIGYTAMYLNRAFVGDVLIALASRYEGERRDRLVRDGLAAAGAVGLLGGAILLLLWALTPRGGDIDLRDLIWIAPFLPAIMLHDTGRCAYLAARRPDRALVVDLVWAGTQGLGVAVMVLSGQTGAPGLLVAWGTGAVAGAIVFGIRERQAPWRGSARGWLAATRGLSGWFTATAVVAQVQVQAVVFLVGFQLSKVEITGLRFVQTVQIQPVQNFISAVQGLLVPRASRAAGDAAGDTEAQRAAGLSRLRRQTSLVALAMLGLAAVFVLVGWPLVAWLLSRSPKFEPFEPLALPVALQAGVYLVQLPFTAAMRGMHRAKLLFVQYVLFAAASIGGLVLGAGTGGLLGAAWGLFGGAVVGLVVMITMYRHAVRALDTRRSGYPLAAPHADQD